MHRNGIVHRDLKMENILLDQDGQIKIIDLGLGNFFDGTNPLKTFCGSPDYAPPELWENKAYLGPEVDVWSLGVILFIMRTGFVPFNDSNHILELRYYWPPNFEISADLQDLIQQIFRPAKTRCTMEDMIAHPWLNDGGKLKHITRLPLYVPSTILNESILLRMEDLGLPRESTEKSVLSTEYNQLRTTYVLLEFQLEEMLRRRRGSHSASASPSPRVRSASDAPSPVSSRKSSLEGSDSSPSPSKGSPRDALRELQVQKKCIIA
jgi:serine/threonine-protein kinase SIK3